MQREQEHECGPDGTGRASKPFASTTPHIQITATVPQHYAVTRALIELSYTCMSLTAPAYLNYACSINLSVRNWYFRDREG